MIRPLSDRVLVKPLEADEKTASGIVLPSTATERPQKGKVMAVGPGKFDEDGEKRVPLEVKVGDIVLYAKYGPTEIKEGGEELLLVREEDILAVIEKEKK
jgi:chaperonin GroES